jgi:hypothetical protein
MKRWAVISFNQDTLLEIAAVNKGGWEPQMGFGVIFSNTPTKPLPDHRIYKPHGSIAWRNPRSILPLRYSDLDRAALSPIWAKRVNSPKIKNSVPLILAPSFLKMYDDRIYWYTMARVTFELQHARHVRVVGFRLRPDDTLVSHLIRVALRNNPYKKGLIELVDPHATSDEAGSMGQAWSPIAAALAEKGWEVKRHPCTFVDYVNWLDKGQNGSP